MGNRCVKKAKPNGTGGSGQDKPGTSPNEQKDFPASDLYPGVKPPKYDPPPEYPFTPSTSTSNVDKGKQEEKKEKPSETSAEPKKAPEKAVKETDKGKELVKKLPPPQKIWGTTEMLPYNFTWTINQFSAWIRQPDDKYKYSPYFYTGNDQWCLALITKALKGRDFISLYLYLKSSHKDNVYAGFKFAILNDDGERTHESGIQYRTFDYLYAMNNTRYKYWGEPEFIRKDILLDEKNGYLSNDRLTLVCDVYSFADAVTYQGQGNKAEWTMSDMLTQTSRLGLRLNKPLF